MEDLLDLSGVKGSNRRKCGSRLSGIRGGKNNFNKKDIASYVREVTGCPLATATKAVDAVTDFIKLYASDTNSCVTISGFGSFRTKKYKYKSRLHGKNYSGTKNKLVFKPSK